MCAFGNKRSQYLDRNQRASDYILSDKAEINKKLHIFVVPSKIIAMSCQNAKYNTYVLNLLKCESFF